MSSASKMAVGEMVMNAARIVSSLLGVGRSSHRGGPARNPISGAWIDTTVAMLSGGSAPSPATVRQLRGYRDESFVDSKKGAEKLSGGDAMIGAL